MNQRYRFNSTRPIPPILVGGCAFILCWLTFMTYYHVKFDLNIPPSTSGDESDYDSIGWELSQGRGFGVNSEDPAFRQPYDLAAKDDLRFHLPKRPQWHVTYRPPLFPYAISFLNRLFGRQFWAIRAMDAAFMAGTLAMISIILYRSHGSFAAFISIVIFIVHDTRTRFYGRAILTEAMSLFLTSILCVAFFRMYQSKAAHQKFFYLHSIGIGLILGLSLLTRTMIVTWAPGIVLLLLWINSSQQRSWKVGIVSVLLCCVTTVGVFLPWAIRNIETTGEFMPLGTQGQVQLSAAFGDIIWESKGEWGNLNQAGFFDEVITDAQSPLEQELAKVHFSKQKAKEWILENPLKSIALIPMKIWKECRPRSIAEIAILFLCAVGVWTAWGNPYATILIAIFATNLVGVAATWSVQGRFLVPLLLPIHIMATLGFYELYRRFNKRPAIEFNP